MTWHYRHILTAILACMDDNITVICCNSSDRSAVTTVVPAYLEGQPFVDPQGHMMLLYLMLFLTRHAWKLLALI